MDLVFLLDLEAKVFDEYLHQSGGYVLQAGVKGRSKAGIKWNKIHPGREIHVQRLDKEMRDDDKEQ